MKNNFSPIHLIFFVLLLLFLFVLIQIEILTFVFEKLGLPPTLGLAVLLLSLFGSAINLPVMRVKSDAQAQEIIQPPFWGYLKPQCNHFAMKPLSPLMWAVV